MANSGYDCQWRTIKDHSSCATEQAAIAYRHKPLEKRHRMATGRPWTKQQSECTMKVRVQHAISQHVQVQSAQSSRTVYAPREKGFAFVIEVGILEA